MEIRLYSLCYRSEALIASHLDPEAFGRYMATGTRKLTRGSLMFFEVDRAKLAPGAFRLENLEQRCAPHTDGSPKASKYISIYRVLENLELDAIKSLHLVTVDGRTLDIAPQAVDDGPAANEFLYQELCPVTPLIASGLKPSAFAKFMTDPKEALCLPKLFFADLMLDHEGGHLAGYLPYDDPAHVVSCLEEVRGRPGKPSKTVSRTPDIHSLYRTVNRGFYLGDQQRVLHFKFPDRRALETEHVKWWRSAQMG